MRRWLLAIVCLLLVIPGCGYRFSEREGGLPQGGTSLYVDLFENRTHEPYLEDLVTNAVVARFARKPELDIVENWNAADLVLTGTVTSYSTTAISYNAQDNITEYRADISVAATLRRASDGKALWKGTVSWNDEYRTDPDKSIQDDRETAAQQLIAERLAEELYFRILDNF